MYLCISRESRKPDIPAIPHYHANSWYNPAQHGHATPGLHPNTPGRQLVWLQLQIIV